MSEQILNSQTAVYVAVLPKDDYVEVFKSEKIAVESLAIRIRRLLEDMFVQCSSTGQDYDETWNMVRSETLLIYASEKLVKGQFNSIIQGYNDFESEKFQAGVHVRYLSSPLSHDEQGWRETLLARLKGAVGLDGVSGLGFDEIIEKVREDHSYLSDREDMVVPDDRVWTVWRCDEPQNEECMGEIEVDVSYFQDNGTPICPGCDRDLTYTRTYLQKFKDRKTDSNRE